MNLNVLEVRAERLYEDIEKYVKKFYPEGSITRFVDGPRKGRECIIDRTYWEIKRTGIEIQIRVRSKRKDGKGFLESDKFDKYYRKVEHFALPRTYKVLYGKNK